MSVLIDTSADFSPEMMEDFRLNLDSVSVAIKRSWRKESVFWLSSADNRAWAQSHARKRVLYLEETDPKAFAKARDEYENGVAWHSYAVYFSKASNVSIPPYFLFKKG